MLERVFRGPPREIVAISKAEGKSITGGIGCGAREALYRNGFNSVVIARQRGKGGARARGTGEGGREERGEKLNDRPRRNAHALVDVLAKRFIIENRCAFGSVEAEEITRAIGACAGASE